MKTALVCLENPRGAFGFSDLFTVISRLPLLGGPLRMGATLYEGYCIRIRASIVRIKTSTIEYLFQR